MEENRKIIYIIYMIKCYENDMNIGTSSHYYFQGQIDYSGSQEKLGN